MSSPTVTGAHFGTTSVAITSSSNTAAIQQAVAGLSQAVSNGQASAFTLGSGPLPALRPGQSGILVDTVGGAALPLTGGYNTAVLAGGSPSAVLGLSNNNNVISGDAGVAFLGLGNSSVTAGGGDNLVAINGITATPGANGSATFGSAKTAISLGDGNDTVGLTGGNNTIAAGGGANLIVLSGGTTDITSTGADTIYAGFHNSGGIVAVDGSTNALGDTVNGGNALVSFVGGSGSNSVLGAGGSDTLYGGSGTNFLAGGVLGNSSIFGGSGQSTLLGGGSGDQLYLQGNQDQTAYAGAGNELLFGSSGTGRDTFVFQNGFTGSGAFDVISNFNTANDTINISGYGAHGYTLASGSTSLITLSDGTKIAVLANITGSNITST